MTCYHPKIRIQDNTKWQTAKDGHKYHPAKIIEANDIGDTLIKKGDLKYTYTTIPCRNCIGCRLDYSRNWANRGYLELKSQNNKDSYFVTLTYDDEHLPKINEYTDSNGVTWTENDDNEWNGILIPKHLETFIDSLRTHERRIGNKRFKYMACGEYGDKNKRPHYHIIFYGLELPLDSFYNSRISDKEIYWQNTVIEKYWKRGISNITEATWNNIAYVARYITKKLNGPESEEYYAKQGQIKEFFRVSKGIGKQYFEEHANEIYKNDEIYIRNKKGVHVAKPPRYYDNLLGKDQEDRLKKIKSKRKKQQERQSKVKDSQISVGRIAQLEIEERTKAESILGLRRKI